MNKAVYRRLGALCAVFILGIVTAGVVSADAGTTLIQDFENEVAVLPEQLERLSWVSVLAGALIALIIQLMLNLIGVSVGAMVVHPDDDGDTASASALGIGAIIWIAMSTLVSLLIGGWLAAYFAGIPDTTDGILHGIMTWGIVTLVSFVLLSNTVGRLLGGAGSLLHQALELIGGTAGVATRAGVDVAQGAGHLTAQALGTIAQGITQAAQTAAEGVSHTTRNAIDSTPNVRQALESQNITFDRIRREAMDMLRQAGVSTEEARQQTEGAVQDLQAAARQASQHPEDAQHILETVLRRVFNRVEDVVEDVDRQSLMEVLTQRTNMNEQELRAFVDRWEGQYNEARGRVNQARESAMTEAQQLRQEAENRARQIQEEAIRRAEDIQRRVRNTVEDVRDEAEERVIDVAQTATSMISRAAAAVVLAMVVGAVAAGIGGALGTPEELPVAEIDTTSFSDF
ncbi:MAG: hypothetical protein OHK0046_32060 [Anaerolineae bacterium]